MIKLVVSDLDGTLLGHNAVLPAEAPALTKKLRQKDILFSIASGRAEWFIEPIAKKLGLRCPYLACNGGTMLYGRDVLKRTQFPIHKMRPIVERAASLGYSIVFTIEGRERVTEITDWLLEDGKKTGQVYYPEPFTAEEWAKAKAEKVLIFDPAHDGGIKEIEAICAQEAEALAVVRYGERSVEVTEASVNKATGLTALLRYLRLSPEETLVVADDQNDIEILRLAGIGAAVANATGDAKAAADYLCAGERFEGVREAVERFCFLS